MPNKSLEKSQAKLADLEKIGLLLQEKRKSLGITQEELAEDLDVSYQTIKYIEQGRRAPSLQMLFKILNKLKLQLIISDK